MFARLQPFTPQETNQYIAHRLQVAGYDLKIPLFSRDAAAMIAEQSEGIPRNINNICFNALSLGYVLRQKTIGEKIIREVVEDLDVGLFRTGKRIRHGIRSAPTEGSPIGDASVCSDEFALVEWQLVAQNRMGRRVSCATVAGCIHWRVGLAPQPSGSERAGTAFANTPFGERSAPAVAVPSPVLQTTVLPTPVLQSPGLPTPLVQPHSPAEDPRSGPAVPPVATKPALAPATISASAKSPVIPPPFRPGTEAATFESLRDPAELWREVGQEKVPAEVSLAKLYLEGTVVPQSCEQARLLLLAASHKGSKDAADLLTDGYSRRCQ